jgi:hypothetical protein
LKKRYQKEQEEFSGIWDSIPYLTDMEQYEDDRYPRFISLTNQPVEGLPEHFSFRTKKGCRAIGYCVKDKHYVVLYENVEIDTGPDGGMLFELEATPAIIGTLFHNKLLADYRLVNLDVARKFHFTRDPFWLRDEYSTEKLAEYAFLLLESKVQDYDKWLYDVYHNTPSKNIASFIDMMIRSINHISVVGDKKMYGKFDRERSAIVFTRNLISTDPAHPKRLVAEVMIIPVDLKNIKFCEDLIDPLHRTYPNPPEELLVLSPQDKEQPDA